MGLTFKRKFAPEEQILFFNSRPLMVKKNKLTPSQEVYLTPLYLLYRHVRDFYEEVTAMMVKKFSFRDQTLKTLGFVNPKLKEMVPVDSCKFFIFPFSLG